MKTELNGNTYDLMDPRQLMELVVLQSRVIEEQEARLQQQNEEQHMHAILITYLCSAIYQLNPHCDMRKMARETFAHARGQGIVTKIEGLIETSLAAVDHHDHPATSH